MTDAERRLWAWLRRKQIDGYRFRRQVPLGPFIADFVCFDARLIIEVDGGQHADIVAQDARRSAWLERQDFRVLRFWNNEVLTDAEGVIALIRRALVGGDPPP